MTLPLPLLQSLQETSPGNAWSAVFEYAWNVFSKPITGKAQLEISDRSRRVAAVDLFLATAGWDLWNSYESSVPRTADELVRWWNGRSAGRAVLILDGLSLREAPWILEGARERGYVIHQARATGAELPAETTPFAKSLGFSSRSSLYDNGAPSSHRLSGARTDTVDLPWLDCLSRIGPAPDWLLWHHWPDTLVHGLDGHGKGIDVLVREAREELTSEAFWDLIERLATGRRVIITGDHGYAASGSFPDVREPDQVKYLKEVYKAGRFSQHPGTESPWLPPIDLLVDSMHGRYRYVLGQRKWKAQGGYPTLTHGGLSVLEVAVPFIELEQPPENGVGHED